MNVKQAILSLLLFTLITPCLMAQKKELSQARSYIKSGKNLDKAEQLMTGLLKDSANLGNKRIYLTWLVAVKGQYDQANANFYLKQKQDTATFFSLTRRLFNIAEMLDSIDVRPDKKGRVAPEYRQKHAAMLHPYRPNLMGGGTFYARKGQWAQALDFFDAYMDCAAQPLFQTYDYATTDPRMAEAAYWATYCGYKMTDAALTLRHAAEAQADSAHLRYTLQFVAEAYRWQADSAHYIETLRKGFSLFPMNPYFFPRLADAYNNAGRHDLALALADSALTVCDSCELFLFAKSSTLLRMQRWEESLTYSKRLIQLNDSLPEAYFNAGSAYVDMAEHAGSRADKKLLRDYYQRARTYIEYYRQLAPAEQKKWAPLLYRIYLNLNLGRQFDEIDRLLNR